METSLVVEVVLKSLVYGVGVVGNIFVIFLILLLREYKKVSHWYVLQLAIADVVFLQTLPFNISEDVNGSWIYPLWACRSLQTVLFLNYYSSILFLMVMAVDRYLAVCRGLSNKVQQCRSRRCSLIVTLFIWILSLLMCIPVAIYSNIVGTYQQCICTIHFPKDPIMWCEKHEYNETDMSFCLEYVFPEVHNEACMWQNVGSGGSGGSGDALIGFDDKYTDIGEISSEERFLLSGEEIPMQGQCVYDDERSGWNAFLLFNFTTMFLLPLFVIGICYSLIIRRLTKSDNISSRNKEKKRVTVMCAVLVLLFFVCWLPFHSVHLAKIRGIEGATATGSLCTTLATVTSILAYVNSALNPYLYNFLGTFKKRIRQVRQHVGVRAVLSATGMSRNAARTTLTVPSNSESSKQNHNNIATEAPSESFPLQTFHPEKEM